MIVSLTKTFSSLGSWRSFTLSSSSVPASPTQAKVRIRLSLVPSSKTLPSRPTPPRRTLLSPSLLSSNTPPSHNSPMPPSSLMRRNKLSTDCFLGVCVGVIYVGLVGVSGVIQVQLGCHWETRMIFIFLDTTKLFFFHQMFPFSCRGLIEATHIRAFCSCLFRVL